MIKVSNEDFIPYSLTISRIKILLIHGFEKIHDKYFVNCKMTA